MITQDELTDMGRDPNAPITYHDRARLLRENARLREEVHAIRTAFDLSEEVLWMWRDALPEESVSAAHVAGARELLRLQKRVRDLRETMARHAQQEELFARDCTTIGDTQRAYGWRCQKAAFDIAAAELEQV